MNEAHWHLVLNHFPIIFPIVGIILMITGLLSKSKAIQRTGYMMFILTAITTIFAMTSGENAEEVVEHLKGVSENLIEHHEHQAEKFALFSYALGGLALIGLFTSFKNNLLSKLLLLISILVSFIVLFLAKETGSSGGEIQHEEIRTYDIQSKHNQKKNNSHKEED